MAAVGSSRSGRGAIVGINVTPMVDIVLVLLIIMMVSATYIVSQSLKVELPKTASSDEAVSSTFVVTITKDGAFHYNEKKISKSQLGNELERARKKAREVNLVVTADQNAKHGDVVSVIDIAKVHGITKFAINVERAQ